MTWQDFGRELRDQMTAEQAALVRRLRVDKKLTWRGVAEDFYDERPDELYGRDLRGNQGVGMDLCEAAAETLGETDGRRRGTDVYDLTEDPARGP